MMVDKVRIAPVGLHLHRVASATAQMELRFLALDQRHTAFEAYVSDPDETQLSGYSSYGDEGLATRFRSVWA